MDRKERFLKNAKKDKIVWIAIFTIAVLFVPSGLIHEVGHIIVCVANGFEYELNVLSIVFSVQCFNTPQPLLLYWALGGLFGTFASLGLFVIPKVRENKGIFIGVSVTAFDHFLKFIFETFVHSAYLSNPYLTTYMSVISLLLMAFLLWFFHYRPKKIT